MTTSPISDLSLALGSTTSASASPIAFRSCTIAPSPPAPPPAPEYYSTDDSTHLTLSPEQLPHSGQPALRLQTDIPHPTSACAAPVKSSRRPRLNLRNKSSAQSLRPVSRTPSLKTAGIYSSLGSASATSSAVPSPVISAMGDITPLPSPLLATDSPGPWKRRTSSREMALPQPASAPLETNDHTPASTDSKKAYGGLTSRPPPTNDTRQPRDGGLAQPQVSAHHARNRSISEYIPDPITVPKRMSTVSGVRAKPDPKTSADGLLRREPHLSEARGLTPIEKPPTPPPSESSLTAGDSSAVSGSSASTKPPGAVFFEARGRYDQKRRRWLAIRVLGQGTFSQVYLATSHTSSSSSGDEDVGPGAASASLRAPDEDPAHQRRSLVAVKICEHGPRGGASEDRIEMSLKRELEIMQSVRHQSLVNLKAWSIERTRAILVLSYYPGGDLFDVATRHVDLLTPSLIRRMFSELVGAVNYLHGQNIVHRDIKLENVLVNLPPSELSPDLDWTTYPYSVITLTDLGLSRRIAPDEKLETRCGSDDYAAPEVIMGQPYDGRATDAWSLGVLLYALLEARLPFDPPPSLGPHGVDYAMQMRMRSRTSHRIARVEWRWYAYGAGEDDEGEGDHEADLEKFKANGLLGAMEVVEGLLKRARSRWPLAKVAETEWVGKGVRVEGGIRFREEEEGEEV
ncbi:kinase-like protein [Parathielavia hyrcaniae]|uniref:Kinase-like protein n=1 Tax=Parathielavia hyrcaniae TaxID=113614 RepID=A0AAN6PZR9_9PEZI|nr:kinase-like protein [Parathielavia hyrcaniae]